MGRPPRSKPPDQLTDTELELMELLWRLGEAPARSVMEAQPAGKARAYTTIATLLRVLESKGLLRTRREGRADLYSPTISRDEYQLRSVHVLARKLFHRRPAALVHRLLDSDDLTTAEIEEIRRLVQEKLR